MRATPSSTGTLLVRDADTRELIPTSAMEELEDAIKTTKPDIVFLDPLVELHTEEENANNEMRQVAAHLRSMAVRFNLSMVLVHHTKKGLVVAGDADAARGASALNGAVRTTLTVTQMTAEEEAELGLSVNARRHFFRLDGRKANYHSLLECEWFEREIRELANGDFVALASPYDPPPDIVVPEVRHAIEESVKRGSAAGPYSNRLSREPRSIKPLFDEHGIRTKEGQRKIMNHLVAAGFDVAEFYNAKRIKAVGFRSPDGLPKANWVEGSIDDVLAEVASADSIQQESDE